MARFIALQLSSPCFNRSQVFNKKEKKKERYYILSQNLTSKFDNNSLYGLHLKQFKFFINHAQ